MQTWRDSVSPGSQHLERTLEVSEHQIGLDHYEQRARVVLRLGRHQLDGAAGLRGVFHEQCDAGQGHADVVSLGEAIQSFLEHPHDLRRLAGPNQQPGQLEEGFGSLGLALTQAFEGSDGGSASALFERFLGLGPRVCRALLGRGAA